MITRFAAAVVLVDYEALWVHVGQRAIPTIRAHCPAVACDLASRRLLFDAEDSVVRLASVRSRKPHRRPNVRVA